MPAVTFELNAKQESAVRAFLEVEKSAEKAGKATQKAAKGGNDALADFAKGAFAAAGGAAAISKAYSLMAADVMKNVAAAKASMEALLKTVAGSGDMAALPQVRAQLMGMHAPGLSMAARTQVFGAVRGAIPGADLSEVMKITREANAYGIKAGLGSEGTADVARIAAELSKVYKNKSAGDLLDLAKHTQESFGNRGSKFEEGSTKAMLRLTAQGMDPRHAHALVLAGLDAQIGPDSVAGLGDQLQGLTAVKAKMVKDPAAQARIAEIEKELSGIDLEQETIRRAGFADSSDAYKGLAGAQHKRAKAAHDEREAGRAGRLELLRQKEFDLRQESSGLAGREIAAPLSQADRARNYLASLPPEQRLTEALSKPDLYAGVFGSQASTFAALASRDPARQASALREAEATDHFANRARQGVADPRTQAHIARQIFEADEAMARETSTAHQRREAFMAFNRARSVKAGGGGLAQALLDYMDSAFAVSNVDPEEAFAGAEKRGLVPKGTVEQFNREYSNTGRVLPGTDNSVVNVRVIENKLPLGTSGRKAGDESIAGPQDD